MSSSPLSILHSSDYRLKSTGLYDQFHLRDLQNTNSEEEGYFQIPMNDEFSILPEWTDNSDPKFKIGSLVSIKSALDPQSRVLPELTAKGWRGRVEQAISYGEDNFYLISLDSITLNKLPEKYLEEIVEDAEQDNPFLFEIPESALKAVEAKDTEAEALSIQRRVYHTYFWGNIKKDTQAKRMFQILTRDAAEDDIGNWLYHFEHNATFPIPAEVEGLLLDEIAPGTPVQVLGIEGVGPKEHLGLIASIQKGKAILSYPLRELLPIDEDAPAQFPLGDYRYWADFSLV